MSTLIGIVVIILCIFPFFMMNRNKNKSKNGLLQKIVLLAKSEGNNITDSEACGDYAIGLDEEKKMLYFIKKTMVDQVPKCINLSTFKACKLVHSSSSANSKSGTYKAINLIELRLLPVENGQNEISLEFYNVNINSQLSGELQSAESWVQKLNQFLK